MSNEFKDYEIEVEANLRELGEFVKEIKLLPRELRTGKCTYSITLLEGGPPILVDFICGRGYFVKQPEEQGDEQEAHFETFQALLSEYSPKYREVFAQRISSRLNSLLTSYPKIA